MRSDEFQHEVVETSAIFGRTVGTKVVFRGDGAATDGTTVYLPSLGEGEISDEAAKVMRGYVDHESGGHQRFSDMPLLMRKYQEYMRQGRKLAKGLHNAMEDVWIEAKTMAVYPGSRENLEAVSRAVNQRTLKKLAKEATFDDVMRFLPVAITWKGRLGYGGEENQELLDMMGEDVMRFVDGVDIERILQCKDTAEVFELSEELERAVLDWSKERERERREEEKEKEKAEEDEGEGDEGEGEGGEPDGEDGEDDGPDSDGAGGTGVEEEGDGGEEGTGSSGGEESEVFEAPSMEEVVKDVARREGLLARDVERYRPYSTEHDRVVRRGEQVPAMRSYRDLFMKRTAADYDELVQGTAAHVNVLRRTLERALLSTQRRDWDFAREDGRLDTRRFTAALSGRTDVFKERQPTPELNTAVQVVVDMSGSMLQANKNKVATQCTIALAEAMEKTGIKCEVIGFHQPTRDERFNPHGKPYTGGRWEPIIMPLFKPFEKRLVQCKADMASLERLVGGNNADSESLMMAWRRLRVRQEKRKVMIVLSDGAPMFFAKVDQVLAGRRHLRGVVEHIQGQGVHVVGIGILSDEVEKYYDHRIVVNSVGELAGSSLKVLAKVLLGESRETKGLIEGIGV